MPSDLLARLRAGDTIRMAVVGGSMTYGSGCNDGDRDNYACAWPRRFQERLQQVFPDANISVSNLAQPGWSYTPWLTSGLVDSLVAFDVVLIDLLVNSQVCWV
jgi:hypothetical protein